MYRYTKKERVSSHVRHICSERGVFYTPPLEKLGERSAKTQKFCPRDWRGNGPVCPGGAEQAGGRRTVKPIGMESPVPP